MEKIYYAKSVLPNGKHPTVKEHLSEVSNLAEVFGKEIDAAQEAYLAGLFHDFGKYSDAFQEVLNHTKERIDHAFCGAAILATAKNNQKLFSVIEAICAHHSELICFGELKPILMKSLSSEESVITASGKNSSLAGKTEYANAYAQFKKDFPAFSFPHFSLFKLDESDSEYIINIKKMLFTRMLFSCLVDADYTTSACEMNSQYLEESERLHFDIQDSLNRLTKYRKIISRTSTADFQLNQFRNKLFQICGEAGLKIPGLFTLTAPTGTGKTLALLHFALTHCEKWGKSRIILVLPFLTLTEQIANVYKEILPDILEDHSQSCLTDQERDFSARWRFPIIITTSVKFFESLFASRPTDCRKLHSIANSVIVFDEAQSLPSELYTATLSAVNELCQRYQSTVVFSSATQPDYSALPDLGARWNPTEILSDYKQYYSSLKRVKVFWEITQPISLECLAEKIKKEKNVCVIVNLRRHAKTLYQLLKDYCNKDDIFLLSTDLCPAHRKEIIKTIKTRKKCAVIATQCIEAGVDLDFDVVFRALAPLDSIIQAAGRCNRNGKKIGKVIVFEPKDTKNPYPDNWYENAAKTVKRLHMDKEIDIHDPEDICRYFREIFADCQDKNSLKRAIFNLDYVTTDREYELIKKRAIQVIVPFEGEISLYNEVYCHIRNEKDISPKLLASASPITVSLFLKDDIEQYAEPIWLSKKSIYAGSNENAGHGNYYILREQHRSKYDDKVGLQFFDQADQCGSMML